MKKFLTIALLFVSFSSFSQSIGVRVDVTPVERFYELMSYIETKNGSALVAKYGEIDLLRATYHQNLKDTLRQQLIEALLATRPYSHNYMHLVRCWNGVGADAYRIAFNMLGSTVPRMDADMTRTWVKFWNNPKRKKLDLNSIKEGIKDIEVDDSLIMSYLPKNSVQSDKFFTLYFTVDGNRGAYTDGDIMVLDLAFGEIKLDSEVDGTIAHELHHICYGDWLEQHITAEPIDSSFREAQILFIMEGTAQYLNFDDGSYSKGIQKLYSNRELLGELLDDVYSGAALKGDNYDLDMARLKKYFPAAKRSDYGQRPTALYYLSYNMYRSIERVGGKEMLDYVIANPKELMTTYNKLYNEEDMYFGPLQEELVNQWRANL